MAFPTISMILIGVVAGWLLWLAGAVMILVSLLVREPGSLFGALLAGLIAVAGGAFLLFNPLAGAVATTVLIAAVLIVDGAFELALALDLRPLRPWRWVLSSALASGVAGLFVAAGAGNRSPSILALLLGTAFAFSGAQGDDPLVDVTAKRADHHRDTIARCDQLIAAYEKWNA